MSNQPSRRAAIKSIVAGTAALGILSPLGAAAEKPKKKKKLKLKDNIHQSVCRWIYEDIPLDDFCEGVKKIGFGAIDLLGPKEWPVIKQHGIWCPMCNGAEISLTQG